MQIIGAWLLALMLLGGCSAVRIGYNQAPTLAWWWLDGYIGFDAAQTPQAKAALRQWFEWHRATQLEDYAALLASAQPLVLQPTTPQQVCGWSARLRERLEVAVDHAVPLATALLPALHEGNLQQLRSKLAKSNRDFERDQLRDDDARLDKAIARWIDRSERLYGRLDARQRELIASGVRDAPFDAKVWQAQRLATQRELLRTLSLATTPTGPAASREREALATLAEHWLHPGEPYRGYQQRLGEYHCELMARLHNSTTPTQRAHARERLQGWEEDVRALAAQASP